MGGTGFVAGIHTADGVRLVGGMDADVLAGVDVASSQRFDGECISVALLASFAVDWGMIEVVNVYQDLHFHNELSRKASGQPPLLLELLLYFQNPDGQPPM